MCTVASDSVFQIDLMCTFTSFGFTCTYCALVGAVPHLTFFRWAVLDPIPVTMLLPSLHASALSPLHLSLARQILSSCLHGKAANYASLFF